MMRNCSISPSTIIGNGIDAKGGLPWEQIKSGWNDTDGASLKVFLSRKYGLYSPTKTKDAVIAVAVERAYHPIKEYLESLPDWGWGAAW